MTKDKKHHTPWYRLDNAAKIFPPLITRRMTEVFRISAVLNREIDPAVLQQALETSIERFPYYRVTLKQGLFWYYLQEIDAIPRARKEVYDPCQRMEPKKENGFFFRVLYHRKKLSVEFCHVLTDGTGGLFFLQCLLARYLELQGNSRAKATGPPCWRDKADPEEFEDAYSRYYKNDVPFPPAAARAFHIPGRLIPPGSLNLITGFIPSGDLVEKARHYKTTVTEYLSAVYLYALQMYIRSQPDSIRKKLMRPIRLMVPVNLRKLYPSKTMRNFFLSVKPGIDPRLGHYSLEEVIMSVYHYMRHEVNEKFINQQIARNIAGERHPLLRIVPLFLKKPVLRFVYNHSAAARHSGVLTNMGVVDLPREYRRHIVRFEAVPNPNPLTRLNIAIISYKNELSLTFASSIEDRTIEKIFFRTLRQQGLHVKIETN